jgi:hypothetical protein
MMYEEYIAFAREIPGEGGRNKSLHVRPQN